MLSSWIWLNQPTPDYKKIPAREAALGNLDLTVQWCSSNQPRNPNCEWKLLLAIWIGLLVLSVEWHGSISREMQLFCLWYTAPHKRNSPHVAKLGPALPNNTRFCQKSPNIAKWLQLIQQAILELTWVQLPVISLLSVSSSPLPLKRCFK